jgi:hypothetical protein
MPQRTFVVVMRLFPKLVVVAAKLCFAEVRRLEVGSTVRITVQ